MKKIINALFLITISVLVIFSYNINNKSLCFSLSQIKDGGIELIFIYLCLFLIMIFSKYNIAMNKIYSNKQAMKAFSVILVILFSVAYMVTYVIHINMSPLIQISLQILLIASIFTMYLFGIKLSSFEWKISIRQLLLVVIAFVILEFPQFIQQGKAFARFNLDFKKDIGSYLFYSIRVFIYPAFYEEVLYRGLLISGLKGYDLSNWEINIIQAIIFGLMHFSNFKGLGFVAIIFISSKIIIGYLLGMLYFKTKSLTPCILLHAFIDIL